MLEAVVTWALACVEVSGVGKSTGGDRALKCNGQTT